MSRYARVNLQAQQRAASFGSAQAVVREWEVRVFEPGAVTANAAFYTSKRDALRDMDRQVSRGWRCEGPYPVR